jgi:hypothetical protein
VASRREGRLRDPEWDVRITELARLVKITKATAVRLELR